MTSFHEAAQVIVELFRLARSRATLGRSDGVVDDYDNPGNVWVSYDAEDGTVITNSVRMNAVVPKIAGIGVKIGLDDEYRLAVVGPDITMQIEQGFNPNINNPANRDAYEFISEDRLQTLKCYPVSTPDDPTTEVVVMDWLYRRGNTWDFLPVQRVDLASFIPAAANTHVMAAIWVKSDNTIEVTTCTERDLSEPLIGNMTALQECQDAASAGSVPVRIWRLYTDQTEVLEADSLGNLIQRVNQPAYEVVQDAGVDVPQRQKLNFIAGSGVTVIITDDAGNDVTDILLEATSGSGYYGDYGYFNYVYESGYAHPQRQILNLIAGTNITFAFADDEVNDTLNLEISASGGGGSADVTIPIQRSWFGI